MTQRLKLKFTDEAQCREALYDGDAPRFLNIVLVGTIYRPTGNTIEVDGIEQDEMQAIEGYHANVLLVDGEDGSALTEFQVFPENPMADWWVA